MKTITILVLVIGLALGLPGTIYLVVCFQALVTMMVTKVGHGN